MKLSLLIPLLFLFTSIFCQKHCEDAVIFYNVENLFDTIDNPDKNDNEFLPSYKKQWNTGKYNDKLIKINQVIDSIDSTPLFIGLVEIENRTVLEDLLKVSKSRTHYKIAHHESFDFRGIDCALLYDSKKVKLTHSEPIRYILPGKDSYTSRDILYCKFSSGKEELHVFVNHWPSRRSGAEKSNILRLTAAKTAKQKIDSILNSDQKANIIFMGDLNDYPENESVKLIQEALKPIITYQSNLFGGSHAYRGEFNILDHILISKGLQSRKGFTYKKKSGEIFTENFLLELYKGNIVPFRTYGGSNWLGGYSDHLPVFFTISSP